VETLKEAFTTFAAVVGTLTGVLTLYAKFLDVKKSAARDSKDADAAMAASILRDPMPGFNRPDELVDLIPLDFPKARDLSAITRARQAVKAPAVALMAAGAISLFFNLLVAGYGYVDNYVTPLSEESQARKALLEGNRRGDFQLAGQTAGTAYRNSDEPNAVMTIFTLLTLSMASAAAIWAGYGMLRLRSYWFSVAGSISIMVGAGFCCMSGIPIGIWSLVILFKPEVSSSFD
jgi:hypothetical protein